jgi:hypothetical protein
MAKKRIDIRLEPEEIAEAQRLAEREGLKLSDILRRWIRKGKQTEEAKK